MRFSLREFLLFAVLVALIAAWWVDRSRLAAAARDRDLWSSRAQSAADLIRTKSGEVLWSVDSITMTQTDSAGRRYKLMKSRRPLELPASGSIAAPDTPLAVPHPVSPGPK